MLTENRGFLIKLASLDPEKERKYAKTEFTNGCEEAFELAYFCLSLISNSGLFE